MEERSAFRRNFAALPTVLKASSAICRPFEKATAFNSPAAYGQSNSAFNSVSADTGLLPISLPFSSRRTWSPVEYTRTFSVLPSLPGQVQLRNSSDQPHALIVSVRPSGTGRWTAISSLLSPQITRRWNRSEEHTSELQSLRHLV